MAFCLQLWAFSLIHIHKARVKAAERKLKIARANAIQQYVVKVNIPQKRTGVKLHHIPQAP